MFDLEKFARLEKIGVASATLTVIDLRTDEKKKMVFYRPGWEFPIDEVRRELAEYGYDVITHARPIVPEATIDWQVVHENMESQQIGAFDPKSILADRRNND